MTVKRAFFLMVGSAVWIAMSAGGVAFADNGPHVSGTGVYGGVGGTANPVTDRCSGCHRAHTAQGPDITIAEQPALCYTCHGAGGTGASTDVQDGNAYTGGGAGQTAAGALRGGGFDYAWIDSGNFTNQLYLSGTSLRTRNRTVPVAAAAAPSTSSHLIGVAGTMWGNDTAAGPGPTGVVLECTSCHDPHGNGNYRILKAVPDGSGTLDPGVVIKDTLSAKVYTLQDYWPGASKADGSAGNATTYQQLGVNGDQVFDGTWDGTTWTQTVGVEPVAAGWQTTATRPVDGFIGNIAAWCVTCHKSYDTGTLGGAAPTTPNANTTFKYRHNGTSNTSYGRPNCVTCHVAHGSNASMAGANSSSIPNPDGTAATHTLVTNGTSVADSRLLRFDNASCTICHAK